MKNLTRFVCLGILITLTGTTIPRESNAAITNGECITIMQRCYVYYFENKRDCENIWLGGITGETETCIKSAKQKFLSCIVRVKRECPQIYKASQPFF